VGARAGGIQRHGPEPGDGSLWTVMDGVLVRIDPATLQLKVLGRLPAP